MASISEDGGGPAGFDDSDVAGGSPRPLLRDVVRCVLGAMRDHPGGCLAFAAPVAVLSGVSTSLLALFPSSPESAGSLTGAFTLFAGLGALLVVSVVFTPLAYVGLAWFGGRAVFEEETGIPDAVERLAERGPRAIGAFLLSVLVVAVPVAFGVLPMLIAGTVGSGPILNAATLLAIAMIPVAVLFTVRLILAVPVAVFEEDTGPVDALRRSWELSLSSFWWLLAALVLIWLPAIALGMILGIPFDASPGDGMVSFVQRATGEVLSSGVQVVAVGVTIGAAYAALVRARTEKTAPLEGEDVRGVVAPPEDGPSAP